jgi:hypothetical protein
MKCHVLRSVLLVAALGSGCALGLVPPTVIEGRAFSSSAPAELTHGMDMPSVEALPGTSWRIAPRGDSVTWTYSERRQVRECRNYCFGVPLQKVGTRERELVLSFDAAGLMRARYRERGPDEPPIDVVLDLPAHRPTEDDWYWLDTRQVAAQDQIEASPDVTAIDADQPTTHGPEPSGRSSGSGARSRRTTSR